MQENEPLDNKKEGDRPRMDYIEQQSSKVQFLYCLIHSRIWSWKHAISHMNSVIWDVFWWWICLCFSSSMRQIFCPLFQHWKKLSEHTLTKCPVQRDSFLLVCGEVWTIVSWQNGLDNNRQYDKTVSVQSIYEWNIRNYLTTDNTGRKLKWQILHKSTTSHLKPDYQGTLQAKK